MSALPGFAFAGAGVGGRATSRPPTMPPPPASTAPALPGGFFWGEPAGTPAGVRTRAPLALLTPKQEFNPGRSLAVRLGRHASGDGAGAAATSSTTPSSAGARADAGSAGAPRMARTTGTMAEVDDYTEQSTFHNVLRTLISAVRIELLKGADDATLFVPPRDDVYDSFFPDSVKREDEPYFRTLRMRGEDVSEAERQKTLELGKKGALRAAAEKAHFRTDDKLEYVFDRRYVPANTGAKGRRKRIKGGDNAIAGMLGPAASGTVVSASGASLRRSRGPSASLTSSASSVRSGATSRSGVGSGPAAGGSSSSSASASSSSSSSGPMRWSKLQQMALEQKRQRCEHVLHILQEELGKEIQRQQRLFQCKPAQLSKTRWLVARERAEAADWIMRILEDYKMVSAIVVADYLRETMEHGDDGAGGAGGGGREAGEAGEAGGAGGAGGGGGGGDGGDGDGAGARRATGGATGELAAIRDGRRVGVDAKGRHKDLIDLVADDMLATTAEERLQRDETAKWVALVRRRPAAAGTFEAMAESNAIEADSAFREALRKERAKLRTVPPPPPPPVPVGEEEEATLPPELVLVGGKGGRRGSVGSVRSARSRGSRGSRRSRRSRRLRSPGGGVGGGDEGGEEEEEEEDGESEEEEEDEEDGRRVGRGRRASLRSGRSGGRSLRRGLSPIVRPGAKGGAGEEDTSAEALLAAASASLEGRPSFTFSKTDKEAAMEQLVDLRGVRGTVSLMLELLNQQPREPPNGRYSHLIGRWMSW